MCLLSERLYVIGQYSDVIIIMRKKVENDRLSIPCQSGLAQVSGNYTGATRSGSIVGVDLISL
jgi:hypothetical protein